MLVRPRFAVAVLALSMLTVTGTASAQDFHCPPPNPPPPAPARPDPIKVPGKPGETGWLLDDTEADANGNKIQVWCLQKVNGPNPPAHNGPDFGYLYKPAGAKDADAVWVGACVFPGGQNDWSKNTDPKTKLFTKLTWFNYEPSPNGTNDWDYSYDPVKNSLTLNKTQGAWNNGEYKSKVIGTDTNPPPKNFGDMKFNNGGTVTQVTLATPGTNGVAGEAVTLVASVNGNNWSYALTATALGGSGTQTDPFTGLAVDVMAGDTFSIAGFNIQSPSVSSAAADPANGGWVVDSSSSNFVTFRATASVEFAPGTQIPGFGFSSSAPAGTIAWTLQSSNDAIASLGVVSGPALPPDQLITAGPSTSVAAGEQTSITATVEAVANPLPGIAVTFTSTSGGVTFNNGSISPDGTSTTIVTASNGQAVASINAGATAVVEVSVPGTALNSSVMVSAQPPPPPPTPTPTPTPSPTPISTTNSTARRTPK